MKFFVALVSTLVSVFAITSTDFSPLAEAHHVFTHKRRYFWAAGLTLSGIIFVLAGVITGAIEAALQYEVQGFVFWSALFTVAFLFGAVGLTFFIGARLAVPVFVARPSLFQELQKHVSLEPLIESLLHSLKEAVKNGSETPARPPEANHTPESEHVGLSH